MLGNWSVRQMKTMSWQTSSKHMSMIRNVSSRCTSPVHQWYLVSSNLERLIFNFGRQWCHKKTKRVDGKPCCNRLSCPQLLMALRFICGLLRDEAVKSAAEIKRVYEEVWLHRRPYSRSIAPVIVSPGPNRMQQSAVTASPYKFPVVGRSGDRRQVGRFPKLWLNYTHLSTLCHRPDGLETAPVRHRTSVAAKETCKQPEDFNSLY